MTGADLALIGRAIEIFGLQRCFIAADLVMHGEWQEPAPYS